MMIRLKVLSLLILVPVLLAMLSLYAPHPEPYGPGTCTLLASCIPLSTAFIGILYVYVPAVVLYSLIAPQAVSLKKTLVVAWSSYALIALSLFGLFAFFWI